MLSLTIIVITIIVIIILRVLGGIRGVDPVRKISGLPNLDPGQNIHYRETAGGFGLEGIQ